MIHGTMDRSASFAHAVRRLPDLRVLTYDRRGYGRSADLPPASRLEPHVDDLVTILDGRTATIIGHSFGGDVAFAFALSRPDLTRAVGAYEPPMPWIPWWPEGGASLRIRGLGIEDPGDVAEEFLKQVAGPAVWDALPERTKSLRRAEGPAVLGDIAALTSGPPPFDVAALAALDVPVFLASGERSKPHQRDGTARLARELGAPLTIISEARHGGHSSHPEDFAEWVRHIVA